MSHSFNTISKIPSWGEYVRRYIIQYNWQQWKTENNLNIQELVSGWESQGFYSIKKIDTFVLTAKFAFEKYLKEKICLK